MSNVLDAKRPFANFETDRGNAGSSPMECRREWKRSALRGNLAVARIKAK